MLKFVPICKNIHLRNNLELKCQFQINLPKREFVTNVKRHVASRSYLLL